MTVKNGKLLYIPNKSSYNLIMLALILNTVYAISIINHIHVSPFLFFAIMVAIIATLFLFLMAVEVKMYSTRWSKMALITGIAQAVRVFFIPAEITQPSFIFGLRFWLATYLLASGICCFVAGVIGIRKYRLRNSAKEVLNG